MKPYPKFSTTVIGAHSVPDWYEALVRKHDWLAPEQVIVTSSCGFNHLPRHVAYGKMQAMTEAKRILGG